MVKSKFGYKYNLKPDQHKTPHKNFSSFLKLMGANELPKSVNLIPKFNPIEDQGQLGACSAFSAGADIEYLYGNPFVSSKLYIYYNGRAVEGTVEDDSGCTLEDQADQLKVYGVCDTAKWPYSIEKFTEKPPEKCYVEGRTYLAGESYRVDNFYEWKQALAMGLPIYFGVTVTDKFEDSVYTGIIPDDVADGEELGGHAILCVGYSIDDKSKCPIRKFISSLFHLSTPSETTYIFRNSWGVDDGDGKRIGLPEYPGYFKISESALKTILMDSWVLVPTKK